MSSPCSQCQPEAGMALAGASSPQRPRGFLWLWHLSTADSTRLIYLWRSSCTSSSLLPALQRQQQHPSSPSHRSSAPCEAEDGEHLFSKTHRQLLDHKTPKGMFRPVCFQLNANRNLFTWDQPPNTFSPLKIKM